MVSKVITDDPEFGCRRHLSRNAFVKSFVFRKGLCDPQSMIFFVVCDFEISARFDGLSFSKPIHFGT